MAAHVLKMLQVQDVSVERCLLGKIVKLCYTQTEIVLRTTLVHSVMYTVSHSLDAVWRWGSITVMKGLAREYACLDGLVIYATSQTLMLSTIYHVLPVYAETVQPVSMELVVACQDTQEVCVILKFWSVRAVLV